MRGVRRPELVVLAAIVVSLPSIDLLLNGSLGLAAALIRFTIAVAFCWAGGAILETLFDTYSRQARQRELEQRIRSLRSGDPEHEPRPDGS
jgi:predicted naringenin-chalcone synthase